MANVLFHSPRHKSAQVSDRGDRARFNAQGITEIDPTDTSLVAAVEGAGGVRVDKEGTEEALTPGTVQTATTLSALVLRNGAGATVLNVRDTNGSGDLLVGPITIAANAERVILFPAALTASGGVFIDVDSGALAATPGFLIP